MSRYSHSQIQTYLTCPRKYQYDKLDGLGKNTQESSLHLALGHAVHYALEYLYNQVTDIKLPDQQKTLDTFQYQRERELEKFNVTLDSEEIKTFYDRGVSYIQRYYTNYHPFDQAITMSVEENIQFPIVDDIDFSGKIDRLDVQGDTLIITDYKTNKRLLPDTKDTNYEQLILYGLGIKQRYGKKFTNIIGKLIYLHLQKEYTRSIDDKLMQEIKSKYLTVAQEIEQAKINYNAGKTEKEWFPTTPGTHCQYCPFQSICPVWKHQWMSDEVAPGDYAPKTIRRLVDEYATLAKQANKIDKDKKLLKEILVEYAQLHGLQRLIGEEYKTPVISKTTLTVPADHAQELQGKLKELGLRDELCKLDTNALLRELRKND